MYRDCVSGGPLTFYSRSAIKGGEPYMGKREMSLWVKVSITAILVVILIFVFAIYVK